LKVENEADNDKSSAPRHCDAGSNPVPQTDLTGLENLLGLTPSAAKIARHLFP
jgi:hypothetical protein